MKYSVMIASLLAVLLSAAGAQAAGAEGQCVQAKFKAQGKLKACLTKNAAAVLGGAPDAAADCRSKFEAALDAADAKAAEAGASCRFVHNGDGTFSDLHTGLMWEEKSTTCPGPHCYTDLFTWMIPAYALIGPWTPEGTLFTDFLSELHQGTTFDGTSTTGCFAGHCDWRIPTVEEASELMPYLDCNSLPCTSQALGVVPSAGFLTATHDPDGWYVAMISATAPVVTVYWSGLKQSEAGAWAVRGGF